MNKKLIICCFSSMLLLLTACSSTKNNRPNFGSEPAPNTYIVKKGDTLFSISWRYGLNQRQVEIDNNISNPSKILIGQKLRLKQNDEADLTPTKSSNTHNVKSSDKTNAPVEYYAGNSTGWVWPLKGRVIREFNTGAIGTTGVRIQGKANQTVNAAASGVVVYQGSGLTGYGNVVIIKHNDGLLSAYGFLSSATVKEGQRVNKKQKIGFVGYIDKNVLGIHFEIRKNGKPVNPKIYIGSKYHF